MAFGVLRQMGSEFLDGCTNRRSPGSQETGAVGYACAWRTGTRACTITYGGSDERPCLGGESQAAGANSRAIVVSALIPGRQSDQTTGVASHCSDCSSVGSDIIALRPSLRVSG